MMKRERPTMSEEAFAFIQRQRDSNWTLDVDTDLQVDDHNLEDYLILRRHLEKMGIPSEEIPRTLTRRQFIAFVRETIQGSGVTVEHIIQQGRLQNKRVQELALWRFLESNGVQRRDFPRPPSLEELKDFVQEMVSGTNLTLDEIFYRARQRAEDLEDTETFANVDFDALDEGPAPTR